MSKAHCSRSSVEDFETRDTNLKIFEQLLVNTHMSSYGIMVGGGAVPVPLS